jgi:hypothetical protein
MASGIVSLLVIGATIFWWWLRRKTDPTQENRDRYKQIDLDIAKQNSQDATIHSTSDLDELERLERVRDKGAGHS